MGAFELEPFAGGTRAVARAVARRRRVTVVGGGDSVAALIEFGLPRKVDISRPGGARRSQLLEGSESPRSRPSTALDGVMAARPSHRPRATGRCT